MLSLAECFIYKPPSRSNYVEILFKFSEAAGKFEIVPRYCSVTSPFFNFMRSNFSISKFCVPHLHTVSLFLPFAATRQRLVLKSGNLKKSKWCAVIVETALYVRIHNQFDYFPSNRSSIVFMNAGIREHCTLLSIYIYGLDYQTNNSRSLVYS
jgi:hypothetical protein